ncbi:MAG: glutamate synthase central domain-containing protein [Caldilineaceae bacterium]
MLILSDRGVSAPTWPPSPRCSSHVEAASACQSARLRAGRLIVLESGEPREVHHCRCWWAYSAAAIPARTCPPTSRHRHGAPGHAHRHRRRNAVMKYIRASVKGVVKVLSKMGISTMQSYCGAQIFEGAGPDQTSWISPVDAQPRRKKAIDQPIYEEEVAIRLRSLPRTADQRTSCLRAASSSGGDGERHLFNPQTIRTCNAATRNNEYDTFAESIRASQ